MAFISWLCSEAVTCYVRTLFDDDDVLKAKCSNYSFVKCGGILRSFNYRWRLKMRQFSLRKNRHKPEREKEGDDISRQTSVEGFPLESDTYAGELLKKSRIIEQKKVAYIKQTFSEVQAANN